MMRVTELVGTARLLETAPLAVLSPDDLDFNTKVVLPVVYRGVEAGTDASNAIRLSRGGDLGDGVYVTAQEWLAKTYGGGPGGKRVVHRYKVDPLFPEDVAYLFGGKKTGELVSLMTGNGIKLWQGDWTSANLEAVLRRNGMELVIGTPNSIGLNQIAVRNPRLLHPLSD